MTKKIFIDACRRQRVERTPVWFMRQAGRYMSEYQQLRQRYSLLEICRQPELAAQVTFQPIRRFRLDAAIIFADILLPLEGFGVAFDFVKGKGPVIDQPVRDATRIEQLRLFEPREELAHVLEAIRLVRERLDPSIALIGFAGAPFTLASYMIEGQASRNYENAKGLMYGNETAWHRLMEKVAAFTSQYLRAQVEAGADAVQLFDSWAGSLSPEDYRRYVLPHSRAILQSVDDTGVPRIHFATGNSGFLELFKEAGADVVGVDWRIEISDARRRLGTDVAIQGNLDPLALLAPRPRLVEKVDSILAAIDGQPGHIFNLGHGILPMTPVESVETVVERVRERSQQAVRPLSSSDLGV